MWLLGEKKILGRSLGNKNWNMNLAWRAEQRFMMTIDKILRGGSPFRNDADFLGVQWRRRRTTIGIDYSKRSDEESGIINHSKMSQQLSLLGPQTTTVLVSLLSVSCLPTGIEWTFFAISTFIGNRIQFDTSGFLYGIYGSDCYYRRC